MSQMSRTRVAKSVKGIQIIFGKSITEVSKIASEGGLR